MNTEESKSVNEDVTPTAAGSNETESSASSGAAVSSGNAVDTEASELAAAKQEATRLKDQLLRTAADFDNFRKRSRREMGDAERKGRDDLLKEMLPVFDNLERAASHARGTADSDAKGLIDGLELVLRQFEDTLSRLGVEKVPGVGSAFDPSVHEAIQQMETSEFAPGTIAAVVQGGYRQGDRLIRPAMVVVAKGPASAPAPSPDNATDSAEPGQDAS